MGLRLLLVNLFWGDFFCLIVCSPLLCFSFVGLLFFGGEGGGEDGYIHTDIHIDRPTDRQTYLLITD